MKKILFLLSFFVLNLLGVMNVSAQSQTVLTGKLTNVTMNNNDYADVTNVSFLLIDNGDGTGTLFGLSAFNASVTFIAD